MTGWNNKNGLKVDKVVATVALIPERLILEQVLLCSSVLNWNRKQPWHTKRASLISCPNLLNRFASKTIYQGINIRIKILVLIGFTFSIRKRHNKKFEKIKIQWFAAWHFLSYQLLSVRWRSRFDNKIFFYFFILVICFFPLMLP